MKISEQLKLQKPLVKFLNKYSLKIIQIMLGLVVILILNTTINIINQTKKQLQNRLLIKKLYKNQTGVSAGKANKKYNKQVKRSP